MPTAYPDAAAEAANAIDEAVRATAEASRRTMQGSQEAMRYSRDLFEGSAEAGRKLFLVSASALTAGMKAAIDIQNVTLATNLQVFDVACRSYRGLATQAIDTTHQTQEAVLEAWQTGARTGEKLFSITSKA
jgi:hypothetical protein